MKKSLLTGSLVLLFSFSSLAGGSDVGSSAGTSEFLADCFMPTEFEIEEIGTELAIYKALTLKTPNVLWQKSVEGRTAALVAVAAGNDYKNLYFVSFSEGSDFYDVFKFNYVFSQAQIKREAQENRIFNEVNLTLINPKSVEDKVTTTYNSTLHLKNLFLDSEVCKRKISK